jgi:hypothetical protein
MVGNTLNVVVVAPKLRRRQAIPGCDSLEDFDLGRVDSGLSHPLPIHLFRHMRLFASPEVAETRTRALLKVSRVTNLVSGRSALPRETAPRARVGPL